MVLHGVLHQLRSWCSDNFKKKTNILFLSLFCSLHVTVFPTKHRLDPDSLCYLLDTTPLVSAVLGDKEWVWRKIEGPVVLICNRSSLSWLTHSAWLTEVKQCAIRHWWVLTEGECLVPHKQQHLHVLTLPLSSFPSWTTAGREDSLPQPTHSYILMTGIASSQLHAQFGII